MIMSGDVNTASSKFTKEPYVYSVVFFHRGIDELKQLLNMF